MGVFPNMICDIANPLERWDDLRVLLAVARQGSLKAAASTLGVNISTVARRVDAFEASMRQHFVDRTPDGTRLTEAAELLLPFAESMEQAAIGFANALDGLEVEPSGMVRVTAPPGLVDHFLAPAIGELLVLYPKLQIEVLSTIGYADLTRREADIALRGMRPTTGDLVATRLMSDVPYMVAASPHVAAELSPLKSLAAVRWVTYASDLGHLPDTRWVVDQVPASQIGFRTNNLTAQVQLARSGAALVLLPRPFERVAGLEEVRLSPKLKKKLEVLPKGSLWIVGHRALRDVPRIAATWAFLEKCLSY